jgi:hypothetical protein
MCDLHLGWRDIEDGMPPITNYVYRKDGKERIVLVSGHISYGEVCWRPYKRPNAHQFSSQKAWKQWQRGAQMRPLRSDE